MYLKNLKTWSLSVFKNRILENTEKKKGVSIYIFGETSCIVLLYLPINTFTSGKWSNCDWNSLIAGDDEHVRCSNVRRFSWPFYQHERNRRRGRTKLLKLNVYLERE